MGEVFMSENKIHAETKRKRIMEFLQLIEKNVHFERFLKPVLTYSFDDDLVYFSIWEEDILEKFGFENIYGHDFKESIFFCPDWMTNQKETLEDDDLDDDDLLEDLDDL